MANIPAVARYANHGHYLSERPMDNRRLGQRNAVLGTIPEIISSPCARETRLPNTRLTLGKKLRETRLDY